jgi:putative flavoprotein involved in K+ transport
MPAVTTVVVGAGHNGLALSRCLTGYGIDHVVLDRGEVANSWRTQRWDSLRLLTPNWMTRLPGHAYAGGDPHGYLSAAQFVEFVTAYAAATAAPVVTGTTVTAVRPDGDGPDGGFEVSTDQGPWTARTVILAAGLTAPVLPPVAAAVPPDLVQVPCTGYRNPEQLPPGGVLVVGASASGLQIAEEVHHSGRPVTLAVGEHVRIPRRYRGRDILEWLDLTGILDERWDRIDDIVRARHLPSMQLVGDHRTLDLNALQDAGVRVVGRLVGAAGSTAQFAGSLANVCALADLKLGRLLDTIDAVAGGAGERFEPTRQPPPTLALDLRAEGIRTVVWATGIGPDFSWLDVPVFDRRGRLVHSGGVSGHPGLYVSGLPVLRRRRSSYIDGAAGDAAELTAHLAAQLGLVAAVPIS